MNKIKEPRTRGRKQARALRAGLKERLLENFRERLVHCGSHDVDQRADLVEECFTELGDAVGWRLLGEEWTYVERLPTVFCIRVADAFWLSRKDISTARRNFMNERELNSFSRLRFPLRVYRGGGNAETITDGLSWTRSRKIAHRFASYACGPRRALFGMAGNEPVIASALVGPEDVFAIKLAREEREVVLFPGTGALVNARIYPSRIMQPVYAAISSGESHAA